MGYRLGVDLGTTFTAAAVSRGDRPELVSLGDDAPEVPTVVFLREDGTLVVGEVASSRGRAAPQRVAREFKRWLGDRTPVLLAGTPYSAHALLAAVLRWVVARVAEREGGPPDAVVVTHPANWGPYKRELMTQVLTMADVPDAQLRPEPVAAAMGYASLQRLAVGDVVAVYDLGGGTFDAAVVTRSADGFAVVGEPAGVEQLGGVDFDDALFAHVLAALGADVDELDPDDPAVVRGLTQLRQDCTTAKVRLSADVEWTVPVGLPGLHTTVRVTRPELEDLVRPALSETLRALRRALRSAGTAPENLSRVLLAGGSSAIPLVSEMLSAELGRPVAVDAPAKHLVALGAALDQVPLPAVVEERPDARRERAGTAARGAAGSGPLSPGTAPPDTAPPDAAPPDAAPSRAGRPGRDARAPGAPGRPAAGGTRRRPGAAVAALALTAALVGVATVDLSRGPAAAPDVAVNGTRLTRGTPAPLDGDDPAHVRVEPAGRVDALSLTLLGADVQADRERDGSWDLGQAHLLVAGAVPARARVDGADVPFVLAPVGARLLSAPAAAALVALLALLAYGESLLAPVRRGRPLRRPQAVALTGVGAGLGLVAAVVGWTLGSTVLSVTLLVACAALGAAAAACGVRALVRRGPGARTPAHPPPSRRPGTDVPRGASSEPDSM